MIIIRKQRNKDSDFEADMFTIEWSKKLNNYISYFPLGSLILLNYFLYSISFYLNLRIILKFRNSFSKD